MDEMGTNNELKDRLRRDRDDWERVLRMLPEEGTEEAREEIARILKRIEASLED